jgi:hypothetical protein
LALKSDSTVQQGFSGIRDDTSMFIKDDHPVDAMKKRLRNRELVTEPGVAGYEVKEVTPGYFRSARKASRAFATPSP